jgi:ribonuclease Z
MVKTMQAAATQNNRPRIAKIFGDILDYHATPIEAAKTAQMAEASDLVLYHIVPPLPVDGLKPVFLTGTQDHFDGKITVSEDGLIVRLLAGQTDIVYIK